MSEKLPSVSGKVLISFLESLGYEVLRQRGSHDRLLKVTPAGKHKLTIIDHNPVAKGTLVEFIGWPAMVGRRGKEVVGLS